MNTNFGVSNNNHHNFNDNNFNYGYSKHNNFQNYQLNYPNDQSTPKTFCQSNLQTILMWIEENKQSLCSTSSSSPINPPKIKLHEHSSDWINHLFIKWTELLYVMKELYNQNVNDNFSSFMEKEDEKLKFRKVKYFEFQFILHKYLTDKNIKILKYLQNNQSIYFNCNNYCNTLSNNGNDFMNIRGEYIWKIMKMFEYKNVMYYLLEKKDFKILFEYIFYFFKNSSLGGNEKFQKILKLILEGLVNQCLMEVINLVKNVDNQLLLNLQEDDNISYDFNNVEEEEEDSNNEEEEDKDGLRLFFEMNLEECFITIGRILYANEQLNYFTNVNYFLRFKNHLNHLVNLKDLLLWYNNKQTLHHLIEHDEMILRVREKIDENWEFDWEITMDYLFRNAIMIPDDIVLNTQQAKTIVIPGNSNGSFPFNTYLNEIPQLSYIKVTSDSDNNVFDENGYLETVASTPLELMNDLQASIESLHSRINYSIKEASYIMSETDKTVFERTRSARARQQQMSSANGPPPNRTNNVNNTNMNSDRMQQSQQQQQLKRTREQETLNQNSQKKNK
ncbi:hypothetical protein ABK040_012249 [Willaertia magna]